MNEVLEKDIGQQVAEPKRVWESMEALAEAVKTDTAVANDYLLHQDEYKVAAEGEAPPEKPAETPSDTPEGAAPSKPGETPEKKPEETPAAPAKKQVTIEVDEADLGTYATGRQLPDAVLEALKGNKEKDKTIDFLKNERVRGLEQELAEERKNQQSLKQQLAEFERKKTERQQKPAERPKRPEIPEIADDDDLIPEEGQAKVKKALKALRDSVGYSEALEKEIDDLKTTVGDLQKSVGARSAQAQPSSEFSAIDRFAARHADKIGSSRKFEEMQQDFIGFMEDLRAVSGTRAPLYAANGGWSPEVQQQYALFHEDSEAGKALKSRCAERGIALPKDFDALNRLYRIRQIQQTHFEQGTDGTPVPISLEKSLLLLDAEGGLAAPEARQATEKPVEKPAEQKPTNAQDLSELERKRLAAEKLAARSNHELPAGEGGGEDDLAKYPYSKFMAQMAKPIGDWTSFELQLFKKVARAKKDEFKAQGTDIEAWLQNQLGERYNEA